MNLLGNKKKWYLIFSGSLVLASIVFLIIFGLKPGIDFSGGSLIEIEIMARETDSQKIRQALKETLAGEVSIYQAGERGWIIKAKEIDENKKREIIEILNLRVGESQEKRFETVGPMVSADLTRKAIWAVALSVLAIIGYIALAFRRLPSFLSSWKFGLAACVALIHDILIVMGLFAILGKFWGYEVDSLFITALLTVLGYSVHDSIVVFDRIRENFKSNSAVAGESVEQVANYSLVQTMARSLNTSLTIILVMLTLLLLGGETLKPFILALLVGMTFGTYSSIFVATPILVYWHVWRQARHSRPSARHKNSLANVTNFS